MSDQYLNERLCEKLAKMDGPIEITKENQEAFLFLWGEAKGQFTSVKEPKIGETISPDDVTLLLTYLNETREGSAF